jgi:hypothetical protein
VWGFAFAVRTKITKLSDAVAELDWLAKHFFQETDWSLHKFPFGLWFRGHTRDGLELEPRVFRSRLPQPKSRRQGTWDESNVYDHLKLLSPSFEQTYHCPFDWLCLMQHYDIPTRLLDWSESILVALYFAVKDEPKRDGELIVLNAKTLNQHTKGRPTIATADNGHVIIRAEMATTRSLRRLSSREVVKKAIEEEPVELPDNWLARCLGPVAVFPRRLNERMTLQTSVFTLHGGKIYSREMGKYYRPDDRIPPPVTLEAIEKEDQTILRRYLIPSTAKGPIKDTLFRLGIHDKLLFPEIDRAASYLQQLWWYNGSRIQ